ncbi:LuxR C-terminal-related transcriptional regulator [Cryobacterium sp. MDB2-33-2]|uniref:LuxR C-terminal-related transcriptional regulator n=1 Tax=Cryobacterium sp. MDB2-33-2 TaxID=1259179 RepID=UPI00106D482E|nr:LuxR C-terminal-related transcriptional regulator [Cryobacterium sp. MDB2-33-2]TFC01915.1 helix-turn-helix transcriptional regulator [Cryobacterium sp. MDB2-33-2]
MSESPLPVLATKLFIPSPRPNAVSRPRLIARLREGLRAGHRATLLSAPAGFGKTTVASQWIADTVAGQPGARVAWLSLDASDNDPSRFLTYLVAALHRADPAVAADAHALPLSSIEGTMAALINDVAAAQHPMVLVLDDFHLIEDGTIRDGLVFLIDHLPPNLHLAILSRSDPLLPLARLRARGELTELRAADLRFTPDEAAAFLNEVMHLGLSPAHVAALDTRTEGWIAGLQLAALSMRDRSDVGGFIQGFTGSHRFVIDYLAEEVLHRQPDHVRAFLFDTTILGRLSAPLCDAVTGRSDSGEMLAALERDNLFVVPLDYRREWYRYHHLFADVLTARVLADGPDRVPDLRRRASEWFERNGLPEDAVAQALAAGDFGRAARVIESTVPGVRKSRQDATLLGWLALLPGDVIRRRPVLGVYRAWSLLVSGDVDAVEPLLADAERALGAPTDDGTPAHDSAAGEELRILPVTIALYRAAVAQARGDVAGTQVQARRALDLTGPDDHFGRGAASGFLGLASWAVGDLGAAVDAFGEVATSLRRSGNLADMLGTTIVMADLLIQQGRLRDAQRACEDALRLAAEQGEPVPQSTADLHVAVSELLRERSDLPAAREQLLIGQALGERASLPENRYRWFAAMSRIDEAEGRLDDALDALGAAERLYRPGFFPEVRPLAAMKARLWIKQGRLGDAQGWADSQGLATTDAPGYLREFDHLTLARLSIARHTSDPQAGSLDATAALLDRLLEAADAGGRAGRVNEILVLQTLAHAAAGNTDLALRPLARALAQAEPEGYVRLFLDEGEPMAALLRTAADEGIAPDYARGLSAAFVREDDPGASARPLAETLSERELHVLRLLATELSGPEIARELYVSVNTLRTHTRHIFGKLEVTNRADAIRRAEKLGLV